jgi:RND superfamily putative drug exporter
MVGDRAVAGGESVPSPVTDALLVPVTLSGDPEDAADFQQTWAEGVLDFTSTGHVVSWIPLFLFVVLFGLSMDYHVFVVSRIREAVAAGLDTRSAIREGLVRSAGVVTSAAAVMVAVFAIFGTLSMIEFKQLGVGLAAAIAIDATIVRILLLPSVMALLGRANWWPAAPNRVQVATPPAPPVYTVAARR